MRKIFLISSLIVLITACSPNTGALMVTATSELIPSSTKSFTATFTNTVAPKITVTAVPTTRPPDQILLSPNGEFIAEFDNAYSHPALEKQVIEILDMNGSHLWKIPYQYQTAMVDPHPQLSIYRWSKDSKYLYFYYNYSPDGGDRAFWWDGFDFQRINVLNGNIEQVIAGKGREYVAFAFSPDETQIAYTRAKDKPGIIFIRNLNTGVEKTAYVIYASKNYARVGDIHWSPAGTEIVFQTETNKYMVQTIYLNLATMKQRLIREYKLYTLFFQGWKDDGTLEFLDYNNDKIIAHVNPRNNETTIIGTSTPTP